MYCDHHVYNSEWKLTVFNIVLITRGLGFEEESVIDSERERDYS